MKKTYKYLIILGIIGISGYLLYNWKWIGFNLGIYDEPSVKKKITEVF